jgi:hypothetical protein
VWGLVGLGGGGLGVAVVALLDAVVVVAQLRLVLDGLGSDFLGLREGKLKKGLRLNGNALGGGTSPRISLKPAYVPIGTVVRKTPITVRAGRSSHE